MAKEKICQGSWEILFASAREAHKSLHLEEAERLYRSALAGAFNLKLEKSTLSNLFLCMGQLQVERGNWPGAEESLRQCIAVYGDSEFQFELEKAVAWRFLSEVLIRQGKLNESRRASDEAQRIVNEVKRHLERCLSLGAKIPPSTKPQLVKEQVLALVSNLKHLVNLRKLLWRPSHASRP